MLNRHLSPELGAALAAEMPRALRHILSRESGEPGESVEAAAALSRRGFLKISGGAGFALGFAPLAATAADAPESPAKGLKPFQQPPSFLRIAPDGTVTVLVNRLEFGQGVHTALPMILAEELDADWSRVRAELGSNDPAFVDPAFGLHMTGGSNSIKNSFMQYRELGA
ncbi:MAG TPA: molybdopterin cofactor-binding domain-containing protein, partial [Burkholderiaceae bacterium]|nr:molybdopterin cofactor-binding domain-containing protein [Burkholderiaceae bacterium]